MRKIIPVILSLLLVAFAGCGQTGPPDETITGASEAVETTASVAIPSTAESTAGSSRAGQPVIVPDSSNQKPDVAEVPKTASEKPSSRPAVSTPALSRPASSEPAKPPSSSSASNTASASSNAGTPTPKTYRAEDLGMTYAQMEDRFRSYAESRGLVYDASLTVENAGFTGRVTSFGETWESFYRAVVRWMDEDISMYAPRAVRVQLVRSKDNTFEYAYVLWM